MPLAVLGGLLISNEGDTIGALDYYSAALEKDPKNTTAWLWQGLDLQASGFVEESIASYQQCLAIDPGYQNCRQHLAVAYLDIGDIETALKIHSETLEHAFLSISEAFVSTYVRTGHRSLALLIADAKFESRGAPVIEWIRAIENPNADNSAGLGRLKDWERQMSTGKKLADVPQLLLSFRAWDELAENAADASWVLWHIDADEFRRTAQFKSIIHETGVFKYWQVRGFPPQCRPVGDDDFECGRPGSGK